jgi:alpha-aminoadipic semialdehyde synthase
MISSVLRQGGRAALRPRATSTAIIGRNVNVNVNALKAAGGSSRRAITLGIAREAYDKWERRAPLCPSHVEALKQHDTSLEVLVQPSPRRIFSDAEYEHAGAIVQDDLQAADIILGVKQPPVDMNHTLLEHKTYMCFAHVIKGQTENMPLLQEMLHQHIRLVDYECITAKADPSSNDPNSSRPKRLVTFGRFAGIAGMLDMCQGLGQQLLAQGYSTPFLHSPLSYMHHDLEGARAAVRAMGTEIATQGLPPQLGGPLVFAFTGNGNVTRGAREIFDLLPMEMITKEQLQEMRSMNCENSNKGDEDNHHTTTATSTHCSQLFDNHKVYGIQVEPKDTVEHTMSSTQGSYTNNYDKDHYRSHPNEYEGIFHREIAPHINVLVNGVYWDERYPRLLTKDQIRELRQNGNQNLVVVADISCDIGGSVEFLEKSTVIEQPFFQYDPLSGETSDSIDGTGICMMGVDILPTELARESSKHFGDALLPLLQQVQVQHEVKASNDASSTETTDGVLSGKQTPIMLIFPEELELATVANNGKLMPRYNYIDALMRRKADDEHKKEIDTASWPSILLALDGHLFDSGLINKVLDIVEHYEECHFALDQCVAGRTQNEGKSSVLIRVKSNDPQVLSDIPKKVEQLIQLIPASDATFSCYDGDDVHHLIARTEHGGDGDESSSSNSSSGYDVPKTGAYVKSHSKSRGGADGNEEKVLVLGAGRVAASLCEYLGRNANRKIVVASNLEHEVSAVTKHATQGRARAQGVVMDVVHNKEGLARLVKEADVVVSLLPAPMHPAVAEECIRSRNTDLVTASYLSDEIKDMQPRCEEAGIVMLMEMGLDPGMDHMSAMKLMDDIRARGGRVTKFRSVCGGLPSPQAASTNDLQYKFSWSPMGVLTASSNPATFLRDGHVVHVPGDQLLASAEPMLYNLWPDLALECLPNRNSLSYGDLYGISDTADTIFRGTLRFAGFSNLMYQLRQLGLFEENAIFSGTSGARTWKELLHAKLEAHGQNHIAEWLEHAAGVGATRQEAERAETFVKWLGLLDDETSESAALVSNPNSIVHSFCDVLQDKLAFAPEEHDMVVMHHTIEAVFDDGRAGGAGCSHELIHSKLRLEGDDHMSAMCKTVGYTAAAGVELLLNGGLGAEQQTGGIFLPIQPQIYNPVLRLLEQEGLKFDETVFLDHIPVIHPQCKALHDQQKSA